MGYFTYVTTLKIHFIIKQTANRGDTETHKADVNLLKGRVCLFGKEA